MKKKLLCLSALLLSACMLFSQPALSVNAIYEEDTNKSQVSDESQVSLSSVGNSWGSSNFEGAPKPPAGTQIIYANSFNLNAVDTEDNSLYFESSCSGYKILSYDASKSIIYGTIVKTELVPADEEFGIPTGEYSHDVLVPYTNSVDLSSVLANELVRQDGDYFKVCANPEAYILLFKDAELKYACKISELANYLKVVDYTPVSTVNPNAKHSVELVSHIYEMGSNDCKSAKFKVVFDLGKSETASYISIDDFGNADLGNKSSGEVEFELDSLANKTYNYYISSMNGNKYEGTFTVDFVTDFGRDYHPDVNDLVPEVTFDGYPTGKVSSGTPVKMHMNTSNVDSMMNFDGASLGNGRYGKTFEFTVRNNGDYYYVASTAGGKYIEGTLKIDFFEGDYVDEEIYVGDDSDPINSSLNDGTNSIEGESVNLAVTSSSLAKTGIETSTIIFVVAGILVFLGVVLVLVKKNKGGVHRNE